MCRTRLWRANALAALPLLLGYGSIASAAAFGQSGDPEAEQAQDAPPPPAPAAQAQPASSKKWELSTIGYVWLAGAWGKTDVIGPAEPVDLDLPFIHLDANKGIGVRDPDFLEAELDSRTAEITLLGGYRVVNDGPVNVDLLAGARMNFFKTSLELEGPNRSAEGSVKKTWFDPIIATRVNAPLGGKWNASAYGD